MFVPGLGVVFSEINSTEEREREKEKKERLKNECEQMVENITLSEVLKYWNRLLRLRFCFP